MQRNHRVFALISGCSVVLMSLSEFWLRCLGSPYRFSATRQWNSKPSQLGSRLGGPHSLWALSRKRCRPRSPPVPNPSPTSSPPREDAGVRDRDADRDGGQPAAPSRPSQRGERNEQKKRTRLRSFKCCGALSNLMNAGVSACDMRQRRELGKRRRSETRIMPPLCRSSPCSLIRHAWKRGLEELPVNRVEDEGQHGRTPLIDPGRIGGPLFQDVFVGTPKWFRGGGPSGTDCRSCHG